MVHFKNSLNKKEKKEQLGSGWKAHYEEKSRDVKMFYEKRHRMVWTEATRQEMKYVRQRVVIL